jgi:hypothetical protein
MLPTSAVQAAPAASTAEMVQKIEALLSGATVVFDVAATLPVGGKARIAWGTEKWPTAVTMGVVVASCAPQGAAWRAVVKKDDAVDHAPLRGFVDRMKSTITATESTSRFKAWKPDEPKSR